jgi:lysophospholipase L1-like esterase
MTRAASAVRCELRSNSVATALVLFLSGLLPGCGGTPTAPTQLLSISCPVAQSAQSIDGSATIVTYPNPAVSGGEGILSTSCSPTSGSRFSVGTTSVTCTAQDTKKQSASCSFQVTVTRVPRLNATRFTAFGDSMTEGFLTSCPVSTLYGLLSVQADLESLRTIRPPGFSAVAYPLRLQSMLAARYALQSITVINQGSGGETAVFGATQFPGVLSNDAPQAVLLLEGVNDINQTHAAAIPQVVSSLRSMVQEARRRGMTVFVGTLLPQRRGACRAFDWSDGVEDVVTANTQIRAMAATEGATLVDLYQGFSGAVGALLGPDGLHPSEAGYQKMADLYYAAIMQRLEQ